MLRERVRSTLLVTLKSGAVFRGVLYDADSQALVLRSAEMVAAGPKGGDAPVDGEAVLLLADVEYAQRLTT